MPALPSSLDAPLAFYMWIWNWGTRLFFDPITWSKLKTPVNPAFYVARPFNRDNNHLEDYEELPFSGLGHGHLFQVKYMPRVPLHRPLSLHSFTWLWTGSCSITSKTLSCKTAMSSRMRIYFQLQTGFVNTVINEGRHKSCMLLAGPLKWKHAAFQHRLA